MSESTFKKVFVMSKEPSWGAEADVVIKINEWAACAGYSGGYTDSAIAEVAYYLKDVIKLFPKYADNLCIATLTEYEYHYELEKYTAEIFEYKRDLNGIIHVDTVKGLKEWCQDKDIDSPREILEATSEYYLNLSRQINKELSSMD